MPVVAGVDCSTQSTKVELRDADTGRLLGEGRAAHPATSPPCSEQDPAVWRDALQSSFDQARQAAGVSRVNAIAIAGQQHGLVVLDADGRVVRPAKLWNDTESAPQAAHLVQLLGRQAWAERCGSVPVASFTVTKLAWLREREPDSFRQLAEVLLPHDWLTRGLVGRSVTDRGDASGTGYWSPRTGEWDLELLALVDPDVDWAAALPSVLAPTEPAGRAALLPGAPLVAAGTGDNMAAALGVGLAPGDVVVSIGTSGTVYSVSETPTHDASGAVAGFADASGRFLPLVCTLNATKVTDTVARLLGVDHAGLDELAQRGRSDGLVLVPYFDGERTPDRPEATGLLSGLRSGASREQLARAAFEGVVCGLLDALDALQAAGVSAHGTLHALGGGAGSTSYLQLLADLSGRPVLPCPGELVARGGAVQAAAALAGAQPADVNESWGSPAGTPVEPRPGASAMNVRAAYTAARDR